MKADTGEHRRVSNSRWLWVFVFLFACAEWAIVFKPDLRSSFTFVRLRPELFPCVDLPKDVDARLLFFNFKIWTIVSLTQAIGWGVVAYISLRWLIGLWRTGEATGRGKRVGQIAIRSLMFGTGLWFFLTPPPSWEMGCFSGHVNVEASGVLAYVAVGLATIVMWILENRVCALPDVAREPSVIIQYLELRHKLQVLLSMASLILASGVLGLMTRRAFLQPISPRSFFPSSIVMEGFEYTILLALAYAPVHAAFNAVGTRLRETLIPPLPAGSGAEAIQSWAKVSNDLGELLQISIYDWKTFGPGFPILAPFLLGLLSNLAKH